MGLFGRKRNNEEEVVDANVAAQPVEAMVPIDRVPFWRSIWPVFACGAGLYSDGYINNVIGSVSTTLSYEYGDEYKYSNAKHYVSDIAFVGTVVGQLLFGILADKWSRRDALLVSTVVMIVFTALAAGSYWYGDDVGMFNMLTAWRFFVGIGIGGEYPAGSVGCAESSGELSAGTRHRWFILFTNTAIDWGFVLGAFVPYVVAAACQNQYYGTIWRTSLGIGVVFPLVLFFMRLKLEEPEEFTRQSMKYVRVPYWLCIKYYAWRLFLVSAIWFLYDFSVYGFGLYASTIVANIYDEDTAPLTTVFGWNTVINLFYIPGTMLGAPLSDWIGPRYALIAGVLCQAVIGFIMAGCYSKLAQPSAIAGFAIVYGIFLSFGELGPGNNIGLLASKTSATGVRGHYYGVASAVGKVGAFVGTWVFPYIEAAGGNATQSAQYPFYVSSCLCILSAFLAWMLPHVTQDTITIEDAKFREYLEANGWDTRQLGLKKGESVDSFALPREPVAAAETKEA